MHPVDDLTIPSGWHPIMVHPTHPNASNGPFAYVSSRLANMVAGDHDLRVFDGRHGNNDRVSSFYDHAQYLATLNELITALYKVGWVEHTSDWDWYLGVQTRDGVWHGDHILTNPVTDETTDPEDDTCCDSLTLPPEPWDHRLTPDHDHGSLPVQLDLWAGGTDPAPLTLMLRDIAIIHLSER